MQFDYNKQAKLTKVVGSKSINKKMLFDEQKETDTQLERASCTK